MGKFITTIIFIGVAAVIFFVPTRSLLDQAKPIITERDEYEKALSQAQEIKSKRDTLQKKRDQFDDNDEQQLNKFLPDTVDSVRLIVEIKDMVKSKPGLILRDINASDKQEELNAALKAVGFSSTKISFVVEGDYFAFKDLIHDLERSLRIVDIVSLDVSVNDVTKVQEFSATLRTYWISSPKENV